MKVTLENFRSWAKKTVDFDDDSLILLSGASGCGKSTILNAIFFALTGEGRNILTHGKSSCKVTLEFNNLTISRSKRPNRLLVQKNGKDYEDDVGQAIINKAFGPLYGQCSYIQQDARNTFLYMSPTEKLEFLETFGFQSIDIASKKEEIKDLLKKRQDSLTKLTSSLETTKDLFDSLPTPKQSKFPLKVDDSEILSTIEKYAKLDSDLQAKEKKLSFQLSEQKANRELQKNLESQLAKIQEKKNETLQQIKAYKEVLSKNNYNEKKYKEIKEELQKVQKFRENAERKKEYETLKKTVEEQEREELKEVEHKRTEISTRLWNDLDEAGTRENIELLKSMLEDSLFLHENSFSTEKQDLLSVTTKEVKRLEDERQELRTKIQELTNTYTCPCCSKLLKMENGSLIQARLTSSSDREETAKKLENVERKLAKLQKDAKSLTVQSNTEQEINERINSINSSNEEPLSPPEDLEEQIKEWQTYLDENLLLEKELKKLQKTKLSSFLTEQKKRLSVLEEKLTQEDMEMPDKDESVLQQDLMDMERSKSEHQTNSVLLKRSEEVLKTLDKEEDDISASFSKITLKDEKDIKEELDRIQEKFQKVRSINEKISEYQKNKGVHDQWKEVKKTVERLEKEEKEAQLDLASISSLRDKVMRAESMFLQHIIDKLAKSTNSILEHFYPDEPMTITLNTFKQVKKDSKPQINMEIFYKGQEFDLLELSGGERDRLDLALTIALSHTFDSPLLMLDECISSLDAVNFTNVLEFLKENNTFKHILLVSHQASEGVFDKVVNF